MIYSEAALLLVAEDTATGRLIGTASVLLEVGAHADLVGEFGRLAVHPEARGRGAGKLLMAERLRRVQGRLHVGFVEARVNEPYSLRIAEGHQFAPVGLMPLKMRLGERESLLPLVRYFGNALALRKNHPHIIPEVYPLAQLALEHCALTPDAIVDEEAPPYPPAEHLDLEELTAEGYTALLCIERGRVRRREIFGPLRLHYGLFKLAAKKSRYLIAREGGRVAGAVGFTLDPIDKVAQVFELIALHDRVVRFLLGSLERACREELGVEYVEVDVSAHAPRMQRTLLELNFLPAAYLPALVFHEVERLDVVRMVRLLAPVPVAPAGLGPRAQALAGAVLRQFASRAVLPRVAQAVRGLSLFAGLSPEQVNRLAGACGLSAFEPGALIFAEGQASSEMYLVLTGQASITVAGTPRPVGAVKAGECLGELSLLTGAAHSATARADTEVEAAVLRHQELVNLVRLRPDIGLLIYKNLATEIGCKLKRSGPARAPRA
jgi:GNAT superfamily N-acetyltransferase